MVEPSGDHTGPRASRSGSPIWTAPVEPSEAAVKIRDEQNSPGVEVSMQGICPLGVVREEKTSRAPSGDQSGANVSISSMMPVATVTGLEPSAFVTSRSQGPSSEGADRYAMRVPSRDQLGAV